VALLHPPFKFPESVPIRWRHVSRFLPSTATLFVRLVIAAGTLVCVHAGADLFQHPVSPQWLVLVALTIASGWATLRVPAMPISFAISDTFTIVGGLLLGPSAGALIAALDGLVLSFRMANDRRTPSRVLFNITSLALSTWVAAQSYTWLAGAEPWREGAYGAVRLLALMAIFGGLHFGLNSGLVATAVGLERKASIPSIWREHFSGLWVSSFGGTFAAMLMLVLSRNSPIATLILMAPLPVIMYVALRHALGRSEDQIVHLQSMNRVYVATIEALAQAVDAKDQVTHDHIRRVQQKSLELAAALGVRDDAELQAIKAASLLHDIGKIGIPEHILNKPGRLTVSEFEIMKRHAEIGADILSVIGFPYPLIPIVRHHHENWDGTGYPDRIAGEAIPIGARILQVVDCFDALTSDRPYRPAMEHDEALKIVSDRAGTMYDPRVVKVLLTLQAKETPQDAASFRRPAPAAARAFPVPAVPAPMPDDPLRLLEAAADLGASLAHCATPARLGEALWGSVRAHVPASSFVFFAYDADGDALVPAYRAGLCAVAAHARIPVGERLSGWVAATRRAIVNSDARLDMDPDLRETTTLRAALAVPVARNKQTLGVLAFYAEAADRFGETHQRLAEAAAHAAAAVLQPRVEVRVPVAV
jgi:putative nucleotidyltransferase with HDIG domain